MNILIRTKKYIIPCLFLKTAVSLFQDVSSRLLDRVSHTGLREDYVILLPSAA